MDMLRNSFLCFGLLIGFALAEEPVTASPNAVEVVEGDIFLDIGSRAILKHMGYGWGDNAHQRGWSGRWITHHEADITFEVSEIKDYLFTLRAEPALKMDKLQSVGLFINNRFVADWVCPYEARPKIYKAEIPASLLKSGENKLSLRIGYTTVPGGAETRRLGLKVDYILMRPAA